MTQRREQRVSVALGLMAGLAAGTVATSAQAQYFGGNKVRYENPDTRVLASEHFDIYSYPEEDALAVESAVLMERWHRRLGEALQHELRGRQPLILYAGHPHFRQTNATSGAIGEGTGGFTEMFKRRIVLPSGGTGAETDHVLGHELVHAYQFDIARKIAEDPSGQRQRVVATRLPLWFIEGMAEYLSIGSVFPHTAMWMRDAVRRNKLPTIQELNRPQYFPYRYGHAFWSYVAGRFGDAVVPKLLRTALTIGNVERAIRLELKIDHKQLSKDWHEALKKEYGPLVEAGRSIKDYGRVLVKSEKIKGAYNLAPSLSPDGKRMLFYSERDLFSIELYLLDVETGEVVRPLTRTATDPHTDSLQFLYSSGGWSPDSKRVVIGSVGDGRPVLRIVDAESGDTIEEHRFPDLVELLHPAWSPDGRQIAFTANQGGRLGLYLFDLQTKARRALVGGPASSQQPAWSPDGKRIAFVTDRFTSNLEQLTYGDYRLASVDVDTGLVTALPSFQRGKNINPQWAPDGKSVYFLSDSQGVPDLYRADVATGAIERLTQLKVGISGVAEVSPALSVAAQSGRIAASLFDKGGRYSIYLLENLQPTPISATPEPGSPPPGVVPPRERLEPRVDGLIAEALPAVQNVQVSPPKDYEAGLTVDYASQVNAGVGTNSAVGTVVGGGVALFWSDMLGNHNLLTAIQAEGNSDTFERNLAAVVAYQNREKRLYWGAAAGQLPSIQVAYEGPVNNGDGTSTESLIRQWQINREVSGNVAYPFTRADRIEFSAGYRHIDYVRDALEVTYVTATGEIVSQNIVDRAAPSSIDLYPVGLAFVHDTSVFGGTAPVKGSRYRLELGALGGGIDLYSPLIDYRQYFMPWEYLSLAGRLMHYGRYGPDAEDPRLGEVFIGSWTLMRGYTASSFSPRECDAVTGECPVYEQLFGSRMALASAEARVPVFGARGLFSTPSVPPIDVAAFYDTGVAWTSDQEASFLGGPRDPVQSYGYSVRLSFFGALVLQWSYVRPLDRPEQDWYWEFIIAPGF